MRQIPPLDADAMSFIDCYHLSTIALIKEIELIERLTIIQAKEEATEVERLVRKVSVLDQVPNTQDRESQNQIGQTVMNQNIKKNS